MVPNYMRLIEADWKELRHVPPSFVDYGQVARIAIDKGRDLALKFVPTDRADYGELARLAVAKNCHALAYVPTNRADYARIVMAAIT